MSARDWLERLRGNGRSAVVQLEPADCRELAAVLAELLDFREGVEAAAEAALDATLELGAENHRLRERVAELESELRAVNGVDCDCDDDMTSDGHGAGCEYGITFQTRRAEKAEAALSRSRNVVAEERHLADVRGEMLTKAEAERDAALAQVAVLRVALERELPEVPRPHVLEVADAQAASMEEVRVRHINKVRERILSTLASTPAPEHDYSGLCAAPSCEGHCGYVHARGCEAVREYLADHGGEPYRAPSKAVTP